MRRDPNLTNEQTLKYAPHAWREWVDGGNASRVRRHVYSSNIVKAKEQIPVEGSQEEKILKKIYTFFSKRDRHHFEYFALRITQEIFESSGAKFLSGWVTQKSSDGGIDFVARNDVGNGLAKIKTIIIGQAKCEGISEPTNGVGISRTVARLKRGWIGVYVTTSYFSNSVQKEVLDDQSPIMLINGLQIAKATQSILYREGIALDDYLETINEEYTKHCKNRRPEEILMD